MNDDIPLTLSEAARKLNLSDQVTRLALLRGELTGFKVGRQWRINPESVERLKRGQAAPKTEAAA